MHSQKLALIAAVASNKVIGCNNQLPWHIPEDLKYFKRMTLGKRIVMGRKTWESFNNRPLPGRQNIVISRKKLALPEGVIQIYSLDEIKNLPPYLPSYTAQNSRSSETDNQIFIIGGGQLYQSALPLISDLYLTEIDEPFEEKHQEAVCFPNVDMTEFTEISREPHYANLVIKNVEKKVPYAFVHYRRK